ncbi:MAG: ligase-associated DNA damage response endonuclease PdeM [Bacteroidota bacterium]
MKFTFADEQFLLLPEKALFWENEKTLILADLHLGKASHFRKQGLAVPTQSIQKDYSILSSLITDYQPNRILILGDLFHSTYNTEWEIFGDFLEKNQSVRFELVMGNHDILPVEKYNSLGLIIMGEIMVHKNLIFSHHPLQSVPENFLNFSGHIHPGIRLEGTGRQSITMPCFYHLDSNFILPAFGSLTGLKVLEKHKNAEIFGISGSRIFKI